MSSSTSSFVNLQKIILVGSGDTFGTPNTTCLIKNVSSKQNVVDNDDDETNSSSTHHQKQQPLCKNCLHAFHNINCRNNRCQTSLLLIFSNNKSILVDCGVTFRDSALKAFRMSAYAFPQICGYIATRNAPDSILGVDDIREVTTRGEKIALYAPSAVLDSLNKMFPYIMPSSKPQSANQALLWTAGLTPVDNGPMKQGAKFSFQTTTSHHHKKKIDGQAKKNSKAAKLCDEPENCCGSASNSDDSQQQQQSEQTVEKSKDGVEIVCIGNSEKESRENCGFVISLEPDGKLTYPNYGGENRSKSKVALYLPFDCFSSSSKNNSNKDDENDNHQHHHYSTPPQEILKHFEIDVAMIAFPQILSSSSPSSQKNETELVDEISTLIRENSDWKDVKINHIVVVCLPHNVVTLEKGEERERGREDVGSCSFGYDTQVVWERV